MGSFIDKLGRLTAEQADEIAKKAEEHRLEQERVAAAEMDRLHQVDIEDRAKAEARAQAVVKRQETLNMAWLAAELLEAADVPKKNWADEEPKYETVGFWRPKEVFVKRVGEFAFDGWRLHKFLETSDVLRLAPDGQVGLVQKEALVTPQGQAVIDRIRKSYEIKLIKFWAGSLEREAEREILDVTRDKQWSEQYTALRHEFVPINRDVKNDADKKLALRYATDDEITEEINREYRFPVCGYVKGDRAEALARGLDIDNRTQTHIAHLLAKNGLEIDHSSIN